MEPITGAVQTYDWGMRTPDCQVAALGAANTGVPAQDGTPYAELWLGTHPSGPAKLTDGTPLKAWLAAAPQERLGPAVAARFGGDLPFLLKILSVAKALSIQAHPDIQLAQKLHAERPDVYKDGNHKPEMALAITTFEAMVGFVSPTQLAAAVTTVPELRTAVGDTHGDAILAACAPDTASPEAAQRALRGSFGQLMGLAAGMVAPLVATLTQRLNAKPRGDLTPHEALALRLEQQYGADVGVLACFFLNHVILQPGEAVALAANEPHAYVAGQCVECMATSDNVVRAGLTPKLRDVGTLCAMLTYTQDPPRVMTGDGQAAGTRVKTYDSSFDEFCVDTFSAAQSSEVVTLPPSDGPSLVLLTSGAATLTATPRDGTAAPTQLAARAGSAVVVLPGHSIGVQPTGDAAAAGVRARVNDAVFTKA